MKDLAELFELRRGDIFLIEGEKKISFGQFIDFSSNLSEEVKKLELKTNLVTLRPDNSSLSLAMIFALLILGLKPSLISRRELTRPAMFNIDQIKELAKRMDSKVLKNISLPLNQEILFWTSGTSSKPKEAILTLSHFYSNALGSSENICFKEGDRWLLSLPIEHVGGFSIILRSLIQGGIVVLTEPGELVLPDGITHFSFVSTQLYRYMKNPKPLPNLKAILLGGSAFSKNLIEKSLEFGLKIHKSYGMTEMASQITTTKSQNYEELLSSGSILSGNELKIVNGDIYVRGASRFLGYRHNQDIERPFDRDGWFKTKDRGEWTKEGYINILGRTDRLFISAGENIQPEFIERTLLDFPGIIKARVVPEKNEEYGFTPSAFVSFEGELDSVKLDRFLKERLTGLQVPKRIQNWAFMPDQYRTAKDL